MEEEGHKFTCICAGRRLAVWLGEEATERRNQKRFNYQLVIFKPLLLGTVKYLQSNY